jgi:beta-galactosidase
MRRNGNGPIEMCLRFPSAKSLAVSLLLAGNLSMAQSGEVHREWPGKDALIVGTCYQPVDRSPEQVHTDVALMKAAGFKLVRLGDLSWDWFEPSDGNFTFSQSDQVIKELNDAGIKVLLDIGGLPAPTWLHHEHPSVNVVTAEGAVLQPAERYMEDISDPVYRAYATRFADALTKHYANNPAIAAIGYDNEIGNGFMSYSAADRLRFIDWLKQKYGTVAELNRAWATQRWSRRLNSLDEVELPNGEGPGPPERFLDLRRFWSDETIGAIEDLNEVRKRNMPDLPTASNLWDTAGRKGFDYYKSYKDFVTYGAEGFYPGDALDAVAGALLTKGDLDTPIWFNEFVTGGGGSYGGPKGVIRMWAYMGLLNYGQTFLAWTFNTHRSGEEQALFGLLDHDGTPSWKYEEFKQIAREFSTLEHEGFPRYRKPQVAIAYSFDSLIASHPSSYSSTARNYFSTPYGEQVRNALQPFFEDNIDAALINVSYSALDYKLLVVPGDYVMDEKSAAAIRKFVGDGGTVIMTAFSAKVDENDQWFDTPLPGRLSDVFGLRTSQFYRPAAMPEVAFEGKPLTATIPFYEVLEPRGAKVLASFTNLPEHSPAITVNSYGKGRAIYLATPAQMALLAPLVRGLYSQLGIERGPETPPGVYARVVHGNTLYVNSTGEPKVIPIGGPRHGEITGKSYSGSVVLGPYEVDLID